MRVSAITTATAWPTKRTVSGAIAGHAPIFIGDAVLGVDHPAADQIADLVVDDLLAGQHGDHARHLLAGGGVDALDLGVGVRAADELRIGHAVQADVVDVAALAGDETLVFLAQRRGRRCLHSHDRSPCRSVVAPLRVAMRQT